MTQKAKSCYVCYSSEDNTVEFGELLPKNSTDSFRVHYFCVLFASKIPQNGDDNDDVYGILIKDIKNTLRHFSKKKCRYCKKGRAASKCIAESCRLNFHARCAIQHEGLLQFVEPCGLNIYCHKHAPQILDEINQRTQEKMRTDIQNRVNRKGLNKSESDQQFTQLDERISARQFEEGNICKICGDPFTKDSLANVITPPCCWSVNGLKPNYRVYGLHRNCIKLQAFYAGYKFKCPFCGDSNVFLNWVNEIGIFVPKRHALWEDSQLENRSLIGITAMCCAETCLCENGREYHDEEKMNDFHILLCFTCGSQSIHRKCIDVPITDPSTYEYQCNMCHNSVVQQTINNDENESRISEVDAMEIDLDDVPIIELHDSDSEPEWTPDQLFDEMDVIKPDIKIPQPIPLFSREYVVQQRNHFRFQIQNWVREQKESGNWN